jgi:hypothetical protein
MLRAKPQRDLSIGGNVQSTAASAKRSHMKLGELIALWEQVLPGHLSLQTSLTGLRGGVLHVLVENSAALFEIDRALRSGAEAEIRRRFSGSLVSVRTRLGKIDASAKRRAGR